MLGSAALGESSVADSVSPSTASTYQLVMMPGLFRLIFDAETFDYWHLNGTPTAFQTSYSNATFDYFDLGEQVGQFTLTGTTLAFSWNHGLLGSPASYGVTPSPEGMAIDRQVTGQPASFVVAGTGTLIYDRIMPQQAGVFAVNPGNERMIHGYPLVEAPGAFMVTTGSATVSFGTTLTQQPGRFTATAVSAQLDAYRVLDGLPVSIVVTPAAARASVVRSASGYGPLFYLFDGQPQTLAHGYALSGSRRMIWITGSAASLAVVRSETQGRGSFSIVLGALSAVRSRVLVLQPGRFTTTGTLSQGSSGFVLNGSPATFALDMSDLATTRTYILALPGWTYNLLPQFVDLDYSGVDVPSSIRFGGYMRPDFFTPYDRPPEPANGMDCEPGCFDIETNVVPLGRTLELMPGTFESFFSEIAA